MENIFLHLLKMSLTAGLLVVVVLLLRVVFCKAPRWIHCLLWALVAVRLLCPITPESSLSLMPDTTAAFSAVTEQLSNPQEEPDTPVVDNAVTDTPVVNTPVTNTPVVDTPVVDTPVVDTPVVTPTPNTPPSASVGTPTTNVAVSAPTPEASVDPWQVAVAVASYVWLAGVVLLAAYAVFTTLRLHRQVREAARLSGRVWCCDHIRSPFILGVFRPRIYLPSDLDGVARDSVIAHEQAHLHRRDHWWKPLGFLLLMVHWFNPLMWVAYILLCRDIEAACDERVVRDMTAPDRKTYSEVLLACSAPRRLVSACPLAFGETSVKSRVKSVLSYKKPTIWIIVAALLVSTVAGVCLLTDPKPEDGKSDTKVTTTPEEDDPPEEPAVAPTHAVFTHTGEPKAQITLELNGNGCTYINSILSSAMPYEGTYVQSENGFLLSFPPTTMTIELNGDFTGLTLRMGQSDTHMSYEQMSYGGKELKNGAVFARTADVRAVSYDAPLTFDTFALDALTDDQHTALYEYKYRKGSLGGKDLPIIPITSADALAAFVGEYLGSSKMDAFGGYDAAFFTDKMLAAVYYSAPSCSVEPQIAAVEYNGAELVTLQVDVYEPGAQNDMEGYWWMLAEVPLDEIPYATAYRAVIRDRIPADYRWATYSHPVTVGDEGDVAVGYYSIFDYCRETLMPLVEGLEWYAPEGGADTDFTYLGYFTIDGQKKYYVSPDKKQLYDGEHFANLTAEQSEQLDFYLRDGNPGEDAIAASVTGTVTEWSKEGDYIILEVTEGDAKLGSRVMAYTTILMPGSAPAVGYSATIYYDGWYQTDAGYSTIYAIDRKWMDADLLGGPEDDEPTNPTTPGEPVEKWLDYTVIVRGEIGNPLSGVKINISSEAIAETITTDSTGVAKVRLPEGVPTGTIEVPQGYIAASEKFTFAAGSTSLTIVLEKEQPVTSAAAVVFNCTRKNMLYDREVEKLFSASSVVSIDSVDALISLMKSYSDFNLPLYPEYDHNAAFFEEYALLITYYETASGSARPRAAEYTYSADGTVLTVVVDELWPSGLVTDDIGEWLILSVIKKSDLQGVTKLTSGLRSKCPENSISFLVNPASDPRHSAEKQSKTITDMEAQTLYRILIGSMSDEEWGGWTFPSDVQFDVKLVLDGDTFYYDIDRDIVIATEGKTVHYMVWTMCFDKLAKRTNMIDWVLARYSDTNDEVWLWEDFEANYYTNDARLVNTPEMREIALRTNWAENNSRNRTYDAQYTIGGALYYIDMEHEEILTADEKQVSPMTKEEVAYLCSLLDAAE